MRSNALSYRRLYSVAVAGVLALPVLACTVDADDPTQAVSPSRNPDADGSPRADLMPHWDALVARSNGAIAVRWSARGTPMSVFGNLSGPGSVVSAAAGCRTRS